MGSLERLATIASLGSEEPEYIIDMAQPQMEMLIDSAAPDPAQIADCLNILLEDKHIVRVS